MKMVGFSSTMSSSNNLTSCNQCTNCVTYYQRQSLCFLNIKLNLKLNNHIKPSSSDEIFNVYSLHARTYWGIVHFIASLKTLTKICARGRYDRYTSLSFNCKHENIHYPFKWKHFKRTQIKRPTLAYFLITTL